MTKEQSQHRYCVIMCGGVGSRFWPSSREVRPKQFIDFLGTGRSLLQMTYDRIRPLVPHENIIFVTNEVYAPLIHKQIPGLSPQQVLLEPARRNTAPCIAWAAHHIHAIDPEASMVVCPADHLITREVEFQRCITNGLDFVEHNEALLTLGIAPNRPETGYGYIQMGQKIAEDIHRVKTFTEKPNTDLAQVFISTGEFLWNSGIFLWRTSVVLGALSEYAPEIASRFARGVNEFGTEREMDFINREFAACPGVSIDYALMEKARNVYVERVDFGWSDLGTWSSLRDNSPRNQQGNVTQGCRVMTYHTSDTIFSETNHDKLIVADGLKDFIVADSDDVLLICPIANEQHIRQYVNDVRQCGGEKFL